MTEKPADGIKGCFLYDFFDKKMFFRVYGDVDPATGHKTFVDYKVCAEDIGVTLDMHDGLSLYESPDGKNRLDWSSKVLGKPSPNQ